MDIFTPIRSFQPSCEQEKCDQAAILAHMRDYPDTILTRQNKIAHLTSSGLILNPVMDAMLMVHHNIYKHWSWTGGHMDGEMDYLAVAVREAKEETGVECAPLCADILSIDILPVWGHVKNGAYVSAHLHLSVAYVLIADPHARTAPRLEENSGVKWVPLPEIAAHAGEPALIEVYNKLIARAKSI